MNTKKSHSAAGRIVFYVAAVIVFLAGIASLINNVTSYIRVVAAYVAQGYDQSSVVAQLLPSSLLPGIFEPLGLYLGLGFVLIGIGILCGKLSALQAAKSDESNDEVVPEAEAPAADTEEAAAVEVTDTIFDDTPKE